MSVKSVLLRSLLKRSKIIRVAPIVIQERHFKYDDPGDRWLRRRTAVAVLGSVIIGTVLTEKKNDDTEVVAGEKRPDLPTFSAEEVSKHDSKQSFWVTYKHGVYDVTKFLPSHPGGEQIYNAAGLSIEPFWNVYGMHKTPEVFKLLESYRIGNLHDDDVVDHTDDEMWVKEPCRDKRLVVKTAKPFNAEIPPKLQVQHFDTPNELFYVRQHMPVPELDADTHTLRVTVVGGKGLKGTELRLSLAELKKKFKSGSLRAALMCAGNRRTEMNKVRPVKGLEWTTGAISQAVWGGVWLRDVLLQAGLSEERTDGLHVVLTGADIDATGTNFSTSIPLRMALDKNSRILLATSMNGQPLPPDHGYPLRCVVPGAPAVRSVKWLESITVSEEESKSHWHQKDYRAFNPSTTWETAHFPSAPPLYSLPVTSALCDPGAGDTVAVNNGRIDLKGYAYSGGGAKILRVDVTCDGGDSWHEAVLQADAAPASVHYAWTLWSCSLPVPKQEQVEIWVKATDSNFNTQPERFNDIWNIRGILSNAYHRVKVNLKH